ncbi:hypothetical protein FA95DRAFT_1581118 [Auriscalpium vulgare]|uniref:Uncharacterized protein n=1 Tax=Auriscalpium vulgare TaxID=40419 RepID=A0ACB8S2H7_9AGAM|nr:hypothetical protein FA95DRAFT_1581118 [Auriscalpium vulgare]
MLSKTSILVALLPLVSALQFNTPTNLTSAAEATISWTQQANDPQVITIELVNTIFHNTFAIANNIQSTAGTITLLLPVIPAGDGYTLEAIDIGNQNNVFATSGDFPALPVSTPASTSTTPFGVTVTQSSTSAASSNAASSGSAAPASSSSSGSFNNNAAQGLGPNLAGVGSMVVMVLGAIAGAAFAL